MVEATHSSCLFLIVRFQAKRHARASKIAAASGANAYVAETRTVFTLSRVYFGSRAKEWARVLTPCSGSTPRLAASGTSELEFDNATSELGPAGKRARINALQHQINVEMKIADACERMLTTDPKCNKKERLRRQQQLVHCESIITTLLRDPANPPSLSLSPPPFPKA